MTSQTQQDRVDQAAEQRRRKRRERAAKSRTPEPKDIVSGAGQPLDPGVRRDLEEQLGHDLSRVRLHTGRDAGQLTDLLGADAVAVGQDVFFREGAYRPGTAEGRRLLAHELLHTVQNPHGLGALRAGRELGAVSLPQQAIEREAESAAQDLVRPEAVRDSVPEVEEGQATPGWLRYATVDADRQRMEKVDPATLIDRLANGVLRSLRGDPEDLSGRVQLQLALMAPQVQESVLDRLETLLATPEVDRLLELVEEAEEGPLPLMAARSPEPVPDQAEIVEQERAQEAAAARDERKAGEKESDDRRQREQQRKDADPAGDGGQERAGQSAAGGAARAPAAQSTSAGSEPSAGQDKEAAGARQQEQAQARQQDQEAAQQAAQEDRESAARGQEEDPPEQSEEQTAGKEGQGAEGEREEDAAEQSGGAEPGALDTSGAEPGEKNRKGGDRDEERRAGDPENEEDADDEPLGLEEESAEQEEDDEDDEDDEEIDEEDDLEAQGEEADDADADPESSLSEGDLTGTTPPVAQRKNETDSPAGGQDDNPGVTESPADEDPSVKAPRDTESRSDGTGGAARSVEEEQESDERFLRDLQSDKSIEQEIGPEPDESAEERTAEGPDEKGSDPADPDDAEREREQAEERKEDAEAKRRDEAARTATESTGGTVPEGGGDTASPGQLSKADEDARKQAAGSSSASSASGPGSSSGSASGSGEGKSAEGSGSKDTNSSAGTGDTSSAQSGTGSGTASVAETGSTAGSSSSVTSSDAAVEGGYGAGSGTASGGSEGVGSDTATKDAVQVRDVTEGKGPATIPGPQTGPENVSTPGHLAAPKLSPGTAAARPMAAAAEARGGGGAPEAEPSAKPEPGRTPARPKAKATPKQRQAAKQVAKNVRRGGGAGGGSGRTATAPRGGGRGGGGRTSGPAKPKQEAPVPDVSKGTPEAGLATASRLKPYQMLETFKGVNGAVNSSVDKERSALRKGPPQMERPIGSPKTVPGGPTASAPGTYTNAKVARTDAAKGKTDEITGEQRPEGQAPGADVPEPSWWDILLTIGGALLKRIFPFDDLIDSIMGMPTSDEGMKGSRVGNAPGLPLQDDSDPQRTDEQGQKLDERKNELHQAGREDAARPMGEDQIYPDVPQETLTGKVAGGGKQAGQKGGGAPRAGGGVPIESASAVAEHDRGPQIQQGFADGQQKIGQERKSKDEKAKNDKQKHDQDLKREVDASTKKQADERERGQSEITDSRDKWRKEQDDKVAEIDDKKGKKYEKVRKDITDKEEETDQQVDKRTEDDNRRIDDEQTAAERGAEQEQEDKKKEAENGDGGFLDQLKQWWEDLKSAIEGFFERARKIVTDVIDRFKQEVFELIDTARNWVVEQINDFADALIAFGDELLADYPAMRDKWRNTINGARDWAVQKVNEAADALKKVAGTLLDGLCGALLAGLDALEGGLMAAVEVAETVTVAAVEFGQAVVQALGDWAAIFNDIVSDPGDWISKAGAAADTGAREHLFDEIKSAVKEWFNQKVQEIIGIPMEDFQALIEGGVSAEEMGKMAWDEALPQLPVIIGVMVVEKVVAKLIPGAGWAMAIIDALQTAWGALSEILAAFGLFMDFLKSVKSGNGALPFAKAVAAGVVALLELIYQFLIEGVSRFMGGLARRLGDMLKNIRGKRRGPGGPDAPGEPGAPGQNNKPDQNNQAGAAGPAHQPGAARPGPTADKPGQRPAPRKPSPDKTSRPEPGPRPGKRSTPEKKPRPAQQPKPKKKRDEQERREEGREVNAARRRLRDAKRRQRRDDDTATPSRPRRGPARDTLRPKKRSPEPDRPGTRRPDDRRRPDRDRDRDRDGRRKPDLTKKRSRRRPESRTRRKLRRARQTIKSALNRARRAGRRLYGKGRKLGSRLNNRARRLRDQWRRQRDRLRRDRGHQRNRQRDRRRQPEGRKDYELPRVRFRMENGEVHTLLFSGRGRSASLAVHSNLSALPAFFHSWKRDIAKIDNDPERKAEQERALSAAMAQSQIVEGLQDQLPEEAPSSRFPQYGTPVYLGMGNAEFQGAMRVLKYHMQKLSDLLDERYSADEEPPLPPTVLPPFSDGPLAHSFKASYIKKETPRGTDTSDRSSVQPAGWKYITDREMSKESAWVRMHMLPAPLGGHATTSNLVPARGVDNIDAAHEVEHPAALAVGKKISGKQLSPAPERMIWYDVNITYWSTYRGFPSSLKMKWGGYDHRGGKWIRRGGGTEWSEQPLPPDSASLPIARINRDSASRIARIANISDYFASAIVKMRKEKGMRFLGLQSLLFALRMGLDLSSKDRVVPPAGAASIKRKEAIEALEEANMNKKLDFTLKS